MAPMREAAYMLAQKNTACRVIAVHATVMQGFCCSLLLKTHGWASIKWNFLCKRFLYLILLVPDVAQVDTSGFVIDTPTTIIILPYEPPAAGDPAAPGPRPWRRSARAGCLGSAP